MPDLTDKQFRRTTDDHLLAKWGYGIHAPKDIVEMAQLAQHLGTVRAGEALVHLNLATTEQVEELLKDKPPGTQLLEYLAQKIDGVRPEIQRILALQDNMPYYRQLGSAHPSLQDQTVMKACIQHEATLISTPTGEACLVFTEHDNARRYGVMGHQERNLDPIRHTLGHAPILAVGSKNAVLSRLNLEYTTTGELEQTHITPASATTDVQKRLINIFEEAIHKKSSNIAFQPDINGMTLARMRLHGDMVPMRSTHAIPPDIAIEMFNTLHAWSSATYTDKKDRVQGQLQGPAGGQFTYRSTDTETFFRASFTLPDSLGGAQLESVSLRLHPRNQLHVRLTDLRIKQDVIDAIDDAMHEQRGVVLLVGSTSSGKSTTIHGALDLYQNIHGHTKNCLSIENPVERLAPGLVAHTISRDFGFDLMMAEILRQDPDLIYVGEIRDRSSASTTIRAANSGHIVLSTLHANDSFLALSAARAYINNHTVDNGSAVMVTDFDLVSSINLIVAQQLVPELCPHCSLPTTLDQQEDFGKRIIRYADKHGLLPSKLDKHAVERAQAIQNIVSALRTSRQPTVADREGASKCKHCEGSGFADCLPINEYFAPDARCKQLLIDMFATNRINFDLIKPYRNRTLFQSALERVADGETPLNSLFV